jgi:hypothetical protein
VTVGVRRDAFGLERRGLVATAAVVAIVLAYVAGLPLVDALLPAEEPTYAPGSSVALTVSAGPTAPPEGRIGFVPASGWQLHTEGSRADRRTLTFESVTMTISVGASARGAAAVERSLERGVRRDYSAVVYESPGTIETTQGVAGVGASFVATGYEGMTAAFARIGTTASVVVAALPGTLRGAVADDVLAMTRSIRFE